MKLIKWVVSLIFDSCFWAIKRVNKTGDAFFWATATRNNWLADRCIFVYFGQGVKFWNSRWLLACREPFVGYHLLLAVPLYPLFLCPFTPLFPPSRYAQSSYLIALPLYRLFLSPFIPLFPPFLYAQCCYLPAVPLYPLFLCSSVPLYLLSLCSSVFGLTPR